MKNKLILVIGFVAVAAPIHARIPSFVADLVGRDLIGAGPLGHVGIASAPDYRMRPTIVLEAMNSVPHIQENTIEDFKSRSKYWGSKGGLVSPQSFESYTVANRIVRQYYACPEYTLTWRWKAGQIDGNTQPISCGIFRCDTLVNYAYAFGAGNYSLPTYDTTWTTPLAVYNYFPVDSDLFAPKRYLQDLLQISTNHYSENINLIDANNVKELRDDVFYQMLQNSPRLSQEKIEYLWKLFTLNEVDNKVKILFYDYISFESPSYLTNEIIKQAKKEKGESRHKLLVILQSIYQTSLKTESNASFKEIVNYFKELQSQDLNKNDGGIVFRGLATLAPKYLEVEKATLTNMDKIHINILSLRNDSSKEVTYVSNIIDNLNHPDDRLVVTASYQYFTALLINDLKFFSDDSKKLFKEHLNKRALIDNQQSMLYTPAYIEFKAALNATVKEEIPTLAYNYLQSLEPNTKDVTLYGFSDFTKKKLNVIND